MNLPLPTPSLEPLLYFVTHGLLVMSSAAIIFFTLGLWFGWLTWARHKRRARAFQEETSLLRHEIASLKRRIAEEAVDAPPLVPIGDDAQAPAVIKESEGLAVAVLASAAAPIAPMAMPDSIQALAAQGPGPVLGTTTSTDSAATASFHVPVMVSEPVPVTITQPEVSALASPPRETLPPVRAKSPPVVGKPKSESAALLLPSPVKDSTPVFHAHLPAGHAGDSITGPIHLPPLPELVEAPAALAVDQGAEQLFHAELADGAVRHDPKLGIVYAVRPERWDDLTLLRGVGEVLQNRLHERGIFTFKQIASWTDETVREVAQQIEAKDRIQRDYWVQQACELHYLKYGERVGE